MLKGLDDVQWLGSAYENDQEFLPLLIRDLTSPDPHTRRRSLESLRNRINHQGTIYESSVQAVPFLIELITIDSIEDKHEIMGLLGIFACPHSPKDGDLGVRLRTVVQQGYPIYTALLDDDDPRIRRRALGLAVSCLETFEEKAALVKSFLAQETVSELIESAIGVFEGLFKSHRLDQQAKSIWVDYFRGYLTRRISPDIKVAALEVLFVIFGEDNSPDDLLEEFFRQVRISDEVGSRNRFYCYNYLVGKFSLPKRVDILLRLIYESHPYSPRNEYYNVLLDQTLDVSAELLTPGSPSPEQVKVWNAIAYDYDLWDSLPALSLQNSRPHPYGLPAILVNEIDRVIDEEIRMELYGLPTRRRAFLKFIETRGVSSEIDEIPTKDKDHFGLELAEYLGWKIRELYLFKYGYFVPNIVARVGPLEADERIQVFAEEMRAILPSDYPLALEILLKVFDDTPPDDISLLQQGHWVRPIVRFIETYGAAFPDISAQALAKIHQRYPGNQTTPS